MKDCYLEFTDFDDNVYSQEDEYSIVGSALRASVGVGKKFLRHTTNSKKEGAYKNLNWKEKLKARYNHQRSLDKKKKFGKLRKEREEVMAQVSSNDPVQALKDSKKKGVLNKLTGGKPNRGKLAGGALVGGAVGAGVANLSSRKWKQELASLKVKPNPTPEDLVKMKSLKRKIAAVTVGGALAGAGLGFAGTKQLIKKK